jgi:ferritin-like metal-binding protein YciE
MGLFTKDIKSMDDLFVHTLRDIYYAENQIAKALPKMAAKAGEARLRQAFQAHLGETEAQIARLEEVFRLHGTQAKGVTCQAIDGIVSEAQEIMGDVADPKVLDAAMLASAQAVEHYEISRYGTLVAWAKQLGREDCARLLQETLDEEKATDAKLSQLAGGTVNANAAAAA